jgi:hypothetical protein
MPFRLSLVLLLFASLLTALTTQAQSTITINGKAFDFDNKNLPINRLMIINTRSNNGVFADAEGKFSIQAKQTDTILFSSIGFMVRKICLKDSLPKKNYFVEVDMHHLQYTLKEISVFANRSLNEIEKDINKLGVKNNYLATGVNVLESPITALYERYSRYGKSKRKVAEWENEDLKRDILKDLFRLYIKNDIIDLSDEDFDAFIRYLNLSDEFIKSASQFELTTAIKAKYENFKYRWKD